MNTYITSDWHINHFNLLSFETGRKFKSIEDMNELIITNINKVVKADDVLYNLGDVFFNTSRDEARYWLNRINCKNKILIRGNHCMEPNYMVSLGFNACMQEAKIMIAKEVVTLSHYPYAYSWYKNTWNWIRGRYKKDNAHYRRPIDRGGYLVHGHTHSDQQFNGRQINVCLEAWEYRAVPVHAIGDYITRHKRGEYK